MTPTTPDDRPWPDRVPVLIAGGGPVGLTLAALLGRYRVPCLVVEADAGYCTGSRAICISRRSQEIFGWLDADRALVSAGLPWTGGRSYYRDTEVLQFEMPSEPGDRFAPMLNIAQFQVEEIAHRAALAGSAPSAVDVRWSSRVVAHRVVGTDADDGPGAGTARVADSGPAGEPATGVEVEVEVDAGGGAVRHRVRADWLIACDGGRSTVRERSGLALTGIQYEGRYVIVDIEQPSARPVERLAWFDPPSNPGSTLLMHRQPGNVWRIDYQIRDDEDPAEAVRPENVLPRVQSHLTMIGETGAWRPLWISIYNAKCLTLEAYRHGRVIFAGDAAHLVPIFGVRGLNSGLDDAGNLAWKLALVVHGGAGDGLLDSYSAERLQATRQNLAYGAKSTEFMAPPHAGFRLMREAALRLAAAGHRKVATLVNPRQSTPIGYAGSPLNGPGDGQRPGPGDPAPDARLADGHLSDGFGHGFVALWFSDDAAPGALLPSTGDEALAADLGLARLQVWRVSRWPADSTVETDGGAGPAHRSASGWLHDPTGQAWHRYAASEGTLVLIRPDGYLLARWPSPDALGLRGAMAPFRQGMAASPAAGAGRVAAWPVEAA